MKTIRIICIIVFFAGLCSCRKNVLNLPGTNALSTAQIFSSTATVNAYLATLYSNLPMEDFSYCNFSYGGFPGNGNEYTADWTDEANWSTSAQDNATMGNGFSQIYKAIRTVNNFIASVPSATGFSKAQVNYWLGEGKFVRAYCYFQLAKYYGGVPLILTVQPTAVSVPRNKEAEVYNQIKTDLESAASLMDATMPNANYGHATKWAAFALEARAMLHAGSIGMFDNTGNLSSTGGINGVDATSAATFMQAAYNAADSIIVSGKFTLYNKYPSNLAQNFEYLFYDVSQGTSNSEGIFYRGYDYATSNNRTHSQDLMALPHAIQSPYGYGGRLMPSMDLVEKFQNADGSTGVFGADKGYNATSNVNVQIHYPSVTAPFVSKDPRFAGTIIAPGTVFRNSADPALGLQGGAVTSQKGVIHNGTIYNANNFNQYFNVNTNTFSASTGAVPPAGYVWGSGNSAGSPTDLGSDIAFWLKKWTDPVTDVSLLRDYTSRTSWMDMRYGEVLMDFAEASFLLNHAPSESLGALNQLRARAGMPAYPTITQDEIRNERFVEFAFENKTFWDYVRWRTLTTAFSNRTEYGLRIYWDIDTQDYVFLKIPVTTGKTYLPKAYYFDLPGSDIASSPAIAKQVNGGHNPGY